MDAEWYCSTNNSKQMVVKSIVSLLYAGAVQSFSITDLGSMDVRDHFQFFCRGHAVKFSCNKSQKFHCMACSKIFDVYWT